jgi:hypothetical protein
MFYSCKARGSQSLRSTESLVDTGQAAMLVTTPVVPLHRLQASINTVLLKLTSKLDPQLSIGATADRHSYQKKNNRISTSVPGNDKSPTNLDDDNPPCSEEWHHCHEMPTP